MKYLAFIMILGLLFISQDFAFSQKKAKKIDVWEIESTYNNWSYEQTPYGVNDHCIVSWQKIFKNNSSYKVATIKFKLLIETKDGITLYKKEHTVKIDLDPGETASTEFFKLKNKVCAGFTMSYENIDISTEIISAN